MAKEQEVRDAVEAFVKSENSSLDAKQLFAAWVLNTQHQLNVLDSLAQTGTGGGDDVSKTDLSNGYAIIPGNAFRPTELLVVRAVFSAEESEVLRGLQDLGQSLCLAGAIALHGEPMIGEGPKLRRLRAALDSMAPNERAHIQLRGELAHLLEHAEGDWLQKPAVSKAYNDLSVTLAHGRVTPQLSLRGPGNMHIPHGWTPVISAAPRKISFSGTRWGTAHESVWIGRGRLADLVELYEHYREALFGKNVRTYLHQEAKKPGSAAQAIRGALESICKGTPNLYFTMAHNGVTLTAPEVKEVSVESVEVSPHGLGMHILNGCQTVHTAWRFRRSCEDRESKDGDRSWREVWREIWIPLRLVATTDEERVRAVTVAANRQTAMRSSAFWAHDAVQIALDRRLGGRGIYYERQESAWENLQDSGSPSLQNYQNGVINIEVLARVIAAAAPDVIVEHTRSPSGIFDNELAYRKVFAPEKLRSTRLLVALVNFQQAVHLALRDLAEVPPTVGMPAKKFQYAIFRLAAMWIAKNDPQWLLAEGDRVYKQQSAAQKDLRERTVKLLGQSHMNIQTVLRGIWRSGDDWCDPYSAKLLKQAASSLRLSQSPFDIDAPADP